MGIRISIVIGLALIAANVQAAPNSWIYSGANGNFLFWDVTTSWSLSESPSITDSADFITNTASKTVSIDDFDTSTSLSNTLVVSNVTIAATGGNTNALFLDSMNDGGEVPLHILNTFTIGAGGVLQITNSMFHVDGTFAVNGSLQLYDGAQVIAQNVTNGSTAALQFALGTNSSPIVVSNNLALAGTLNAIDGGGFVTNATYTLFTYGGVLTYNGLSVGTLPDGASATINTSTVGQVNLVVGSGSSGSSTSSIQIISIVRSTNDIVVTWKATGAQTDVVQAMNGGTSGYNSNGLQNISGSIVLSGSTTTNYLDQGGATNMPSRFYRVRLVQ
jgi:hypothetical protein